MAHVIATASLRHLLFTFVSKLRHVSRVRQDSPSTRRGGVRLTSWSTASGSAPAQPARLCGRSAQPTGALPPSSTLGGRSTPRHCAITPAPCPEGACGHGSRPCPRTLQSSSWTVPPSPHCGDGACSRRRNDPVVGDNYEDRDLVFCRPDDRPYHPEAFWKAFDRRFRRAAVVSPNQRTPKVPRRRDRRPGAGQHPK